MLNSADRIANEKAERDAGAKAARRAEEASIVSGLRAILQPDEQLLGFARGCIAGGIKGRLNIGPEAFFAPFVNIGLTERRVVLQHLHGETGKPSEILPHFFAISDLQTIHFSDIETYGGTPASRLVLQLANGQSFRLRLTGENNFASSKALAEVFKSLTSVRKSSSGPTQRVCISCRHIMDRPSKFCPYCGVTQGDVEPAASVGVTVEGEINSVTNVDAEIEKVTVVVTERHTDLLDDALSFLANDMTVSTNFESAAAPEAPVEPSVPDFDASDSDSASTSLADSAFTRPVPEGEFSPTPTNEILSEAPDGEAIEGAAANEGMPDFSIPVPISEETTPLDVSAEYEVVVDAAPTHMDPSDEPESEAGWTSTEVVSDIEAPEFSHPSEPEPPQFAADHHDEPRDNTQDNPQDHSTSAHEATVSFSYTAASGASTSVSAAPAASHGYGYSYAYGNETPPAPPNAVNPIVQPEQSNNDAAAPGVTFTASAFTFGDLGESLETAAQPAPQPAAESSPPTDARAAERTPTLRVHFHIQHPSVKFDAIITGKDADEVVSILKDRVVADLKFPIKLAAMRLTPLDFAREIVLKYNQEERQSLPRPNSCREFLHLVEAIGYATVESV